VSRSAHRIRPATSRFPTRAVNARSVEAWSIGAVKRTESAANLDTPVHPFRGRNRTTPGASGRSVAVTDAAGAGVAVTVEASRDGVVAVGSTAISMRRNSVSAERVGAVVDRAPVGAVDTVETANVPATSASATTAGRLGSARRSTD
jgi:hypothetical protein